MAIPEWKLDKTADDAASYRFANTNPKLVFLLALFVAIATVACIYGAYVLLNMAIDADLIAEPLRLDGLVP